MAKIEKTNVEDILALTPNQEGVLFHYLQNGGGQYTIQLALTFKGKLDISLFKQAWQEVINCNEVLRTVFSWTGIKQPVQIVMKKYLPHIEFYDYTQDAGLVHELKKKDQQERFDLETACYRLKLCKLNDTEHMLLFSIHHIIYDGWSNGILWKEFLQAYNHLEKQETVSLGAKTKYKQFIKLLAKSDKARQKEFWRHYLEDIDEFPLLHQKNSGIQTTTGGPAHFRTKLDETVHRKLNAFLKQRNMSLSTVIYALWGMLLQSYCNSTKVVFGKVSSGRNIDLPGIQEMVGFFINIQPLSIDFEPDMTVERYLEKIRATILAMEEYETTPLSSIMDYLNYRGKGELFNSIVVVENYPLDERLLRYDRGLSLENYAVDEANHYDLTFSVEVFHDIAFTILYNGQKFNESFIKGIAEHFHCLLTRMLDGRDLKLSDIGLLTQEESYQILHTFNTTATPLPADQTVLDWFENQVDLAPDRPAVIFQNEMLTYREFNTRVNRLAHYLRELGVRRNTVVGILAERSIDMLIGIFGIVKAGGAYLPLDPQHPTQRIHTLLEDAGITLLLTQPQHISRIHREVTIVDLQMVADLQQPASNPNKITEPEDACYVIYTSGTTGKPKGVLIEHRSLLNRLLWMQKNSPIGPGDVVMQKTTYTFDVSVWELFWWAMQGACLYLVEPGAQQDPRLLLEAILSQHITALHFVPSMLHMLVFYLENSPAQTWFKGVKYVIASGEALTQELVRRFYQIADTAEVQLINLYGPTEATIDVSYYHCLREEVPCIPIGKPIDNTQLYIVSPLGQLQPIGIPGELLIGGIGLARAYLHQPELTAQKFVTSPFQEGQRLYKTGDLARWLPDGNLEYLGRIDTQVKVRGYRIELGEIEQSIRGFRGVRDVVVQVKQHTDKEMYIYAYILSDDAFDGNALKRHLMEVLPLYMIPAFILPLKHFPVQGNGKVDRAELMRIGSKQGETPEQIATLPQDRIEAQILGLWKEVLPTENIGRHDNYFDVGGNSINLIRVYGKLQPLFPEKITTITSLFQYPTVSSLANYLTHSAEVEREEAEAQPAHKQATTRESNDIAIIGMSGHFPGAENISQYWKNLANGTESIHFFSDEELREAGVDTDLIENPAYVKAIGRLKGVRHFDARFFGFSSKEAELLDPQIRLFMECVWETLEDAGYASQQQNHTIGMYAGASPNPFWETMAFQTGKTQTLGDFASEKLMNKDHIASQVSYKLNLTGPVFSLYTACSTSLVAVHLACQALLNNECSMAIAGGVSAVAYYGEHGYVYQEGMMFSPDGHCRAFDNSAQGFVGGMGVGSVMLKRLDQALEDRDTIYAVIKGTAINNDGNRKVGYTALSIEAQVETIRSAMQKGGVVPETIGYVETHGTGTELGDPVELKALELAFNSKERNFCAVGSVKPCIGHLDCASGIASLIKTVLALKHAQIPPAVNFHIPNTKINFIDGPFYVNTEREEWQRGESPRRAGVNSLGLGGTNAHVILEEFIPEKSNDASNGEPGLFILSAMSQKALLDQCANLKAFLEKHNEVDLPAIAYTLQVGRQTFEYRKAFLSQDKADAVRQLAMENTEEHSKIGAPPVLLLGFKDSERSYTHIDIELCSANPMIKGGIERCAEIIQSLINLDFRKDIFQAPAWREQIEILKVTILAGFVYRYAVTHTLMQMGIKPSYLIGDGPGEILSACLSGILSLKESIVLLLHLYHNDTYSIPQETLEAISPSIPTIASYSRKIQGWLPADTALSKHYWLTLDISTDIEMRNVRDILPQEDKSQKIVLLGAASLDNMDGLLLPIKSATLSGTAQFLHIVGVLWEKGFDINWSTYHSSHKPWKVSLPTYPFEKKEYWMQGNPLKKSDFTEKTERVVKHTDRADWFYIPNWEVQPPSNVMPDHASQWLIFANDHHFNKAFTDQLSQNRNVVLIRPEAAYRKINNNLYEINIRDENTYLQLLEELEKSDFYADRILHTFCINSEGPGEAFYNGFYSLLYLIRSLSGKFSRKQLELNILTQNSCYVTGSEELQPEYAMVTSVCLVASQEIPMIRCRQIDIDAFPHLEWKKINLMKQVISEVSTPISHPMIAYRNNQRWVKNYKQFKPADENNLPIKANGVYVLIGGLGGVGLVLSQALAEKKAKLVLAGRSKFPQKSEWEEWIQKHGSSDSTSKTITKLRQMEQSGAEIHTVSADATDEKQMKALFEFILNKYRKVDGVIYAPVAKGASLFKTINELTIDDCREQFKPKVDGLMLLEKVLGNQELDFCLIMSSSSSILGGLGFMAYSASNAFMDMFTLKHNSTHPTSWITVNWESWDLETNQNAFNYEAEIKELAMTPREGVDVFRRVLNSKNIGQIVISSGDLHSRVEKWVYMSQLNGTLQDKTRGQELRPELTSEYTAPQNELEEEIASVWKEYFSLDKIGVDDNLFELGATSLSIIQLNNNLRNRINKNIPVVKFFAHPTIRALASYLTGTPEEKKSTGIERTQEVDKGRNSARLRLELRKRS